MEQAEGLKECCSEVTAAKSKSALHPQWIRLKGCCKVSAVKEGSPMESRLKDCCNEVRLCSKLKTLSSE